jgi:hypothetical protein
VDEKLKENDLIVPMWKLYRGKTGTSIITFSTPESLEAILYYLKLDPPESLEAILYYLKLDPPESLDDPLFRSRKFKGKPLS